MLLPVSTDPRFGHFLLRSRLRSAHRHIDTALTIGGGRHYIEILHATQRPLTPEVHHINAVKSLDFGL